MEYDPTLENLLLQHGFNSINIDNVFDTYLLRRIQRIELYEVIESLLRTNSHLEGTIFTLPLDNANIDVVIILYIGLSSKKIHKILQLKCFI